MSKLKIYYNRSSELMVHYPCAACTKNVSSRHKVICWDHCNQQVHIRYNDLNDLGYYNLLKSKNKFQYCILCTSEMLPFCTINSIISLPEENLNKPTEALISLLNQLHNFTGNKKKMNSSCQTVNIEKQIISRSFPTTSKGRPCLFFR